MFRAQGWEGGRTFRVGLAREKQDGMEEGEGVVGGKDVSTVNRTTQEGRLCWCQNEGVKGEYASSLRRSDEGEVEKRRA